ncbi:MAG: hypothetical protein WDO73_09895 [Ignavibacteriota bacterium]
MTRSTTRWAATEVRQVVDGLLLRGCGGESATVVGVQRVRMNPALLSPGLAQGACRLRNCCCRTPEMAPSTRCFDNNNAELIAPAPVFVVELSQALRSTRSFL